MRRRAFLSVALAFLVGLLLGLTVTKLAHVRLGAGGREVVAVIDADIPGTCVYLRGELLGEVPLALTRERLTGLGLDVAAGPASDRLGIDGWGEALFFGREDEHEVKLMLQVPDEFADQFLAVETPWGRRTKMGPWEANIYGADRPSSVRAHFQPARTADGLRFRLAVPDRVQRGAEGVAVEVTCENAGPTTAAGGRPDVSVGWGGPDTPWRRRTWVSDVPLPAEWERIAPGQTVRATVEIPAPGVAGDYEVFATFGYNEPAAGQSQRPHGSYSDTRLLRVR